MGKILVLTSVDLFSAAEYSHKKIAYVKYGILMHCAHNRIPKNITAASIIIVCLAVNLFGFPCHRSALAESRLETASSKREKPPAHPGEAYPAENQTLLIGIGDSLTQGTMDATINATTTQNAYLQNVADSLAHVMNVFFSQPLLDYAGNRLQPFSLPTNLGVDGSDIFSIEGIAYYQRAGTPISYVNPDYLCKSIVPWRLRSEYDKVLYPINLLARRPVSQIGAAVWLLNKFQFLSEHNNTIVMFWIGNNDSAAAALGLGGENPAFLPIPLEQIEPEIKPRVRFLLRWAQNKGIVSFAPYTMANIERNVTVLRDFSNQYDHLLTRLKTGARSSVPEAELFVLTLPYYSSVGYLFDSEDLEFYLRKVNPNYTLPATFKRVAEPGQPITDPVAGDRVSLLTFGCMYLLLHSNYPVSYVNQILETAGKQNDGLVLSEEEQRYIMARIDDYNSAIKTATANYGFHAHLIDIGQYLNDALTGKTVITIDKRRINRKWCRGGGFTMDGVHPGYTGQAIIANYILEQLNEQLGLAAPLYDLSEIMQHDPYIDRDGDGWVPGPQYAASGFTELLFLFKDPDDSDPNMQPNLPVDVWDLFSDILH